MIAAAEVLLREPLRIDELKEVVKQDQLYLSLAITAMIAIEMLLIYLGGARWLEAWTAEWKDQLLGLLSFFWGLTTAAAIGYLLARVFAPTTENEGVIVLFFFLGMIILMPFEGIAMYAYGKRKGLPMWPHKLDR
jgi:hypothetical protein